MRFLHGQLGAEILHLMSQHLMCNVPSTVPFNAAHDSTAQNAQGAILGALPGHEDLESGTPKKETNSSHEYKISPEGSGPQRSEQQGGYSAMQRTTTHRSTPYHSTSSGEATYNVQRIASQHSTARAGQRTGRQTCR